MDDLAMLRRRLDALESLVNIADALRPDIPEDELYELALQSFCSLAGYEAGTLWRYNGGAYTCVARYGLERQRAALRAVAGHRDVRCLRGDEAAAADGGRDDAHRLQLLEGAHDRVAVDVELLRQIRSLLYEEGYTIKGAQKLLRAKRGRAGGAGEPEPLATRAVSPPPSLAGAGAGTPTTFPSLMTSSFRDQYAGPVVSEPGTAPPPWVV